jgi:hypothetical protein
VASERVILRPVATFSAEQWHHRAAFQRELARFDPNRPGDDPGLAFERINEFRGLTAGQS